MWQGDRGRARSGMLDSVLGAQGDTMRAGERHGFLAALVMERSERGAMDTYEHTAHSTQHGAAGSASTESRAPSRKGDELHLTPPIIKITSQQQLPHNSIQQDRAAKKTVQQSCWAAGAWVLHSSSSPAGAVACLRSGKSSRVSREPRALLFMR